MKCHAGDAKIGQSNPILRKQQKIVGLNVAVNNALAVCVRDGRQHLVGVLKGQRGRQPLLQPIVQAHLAERRHDDELPLNVVGVLERQDVRVVEPRYQADFCGTHPAFRCSASGRKAS